MLIGPPKILIEHDDEKEASIRHAIRKEFKLQITYTDVKGEGSTTQNPLIPFFNAMWNIFPIVLQKDLAGIAKTNSMVKSIFDGVSDTTVGQIQAFIFHLRDGHDKIRVN